ncbi:MAG TPA: hypothetical protein VF584_14620 [Longimicrobium sp.]|jgi:hypothetical protein
MNTPFTNQPPPEPSDGKPDQPEYAQDLIELRDRMAADGVHIQIPRIGAKVKLPEPIEVEGETASQILIRWRHAPHETLLPRLVCVSKAVRR